MKLEKATKTAITAFLGFALGFAVRGMSESAFAMKHGDRLGDKLVQKLDLSSADEGRIRGILKDSRNEIASLRSEIQPRFQEIQSRTRTQIEVLLTPEQKTRFAEFQQELEKRRTEMQHESGMPFAGGFRAPL